MEAVASSLRSSAVKATKKVANGREQGVRVPGHYGSLQEVSSRRLPWRSQAHLDPSQGEGGRGRESFNRARPDRATTMHRAIHAHEAARSKPRRGHLGSWLLGGLGALVGSATVLLSAPSSEGRVARSREEPYRPFALFGAAFRAIRMQAADERSERQLVDAALRSMVASLDPYSRYLTADELGKFDEADVGELRGHRH